MNLLVLTPPLLDREPQHRVKWLNWLQTIRHVPYLHHIKSMNLRISYGGINVLFQRKLRVAGTFDYPLVLPCFDGHFKKIHSQITG